MTIQIATNQFKDYLVIERAYSPQTIDAYGRDLIGFSSYLQKKGLTSQVGDISQADIVGYLAYLASNEDGKQPNIASTRARKLASIRSFFTFLRKRKIIVTNPADDIDIPSLPIKEPDYLTPAEYQRLLQVIRESASPFFKLRDTLIVSLFLSSGLRVSELVGIELEHLDLTNKTIKVHRKRNKFQTLPLNDEVAILFEEYLKVRPPAKTSQVFVSKKHNGMKANTVFCMVRKYLRQAGIQKSRACHLLRHTCFSSLLANGVNLVVIQQLANHSNLNTTRRYLHLNDLQVRSAVQTIQFSKGEI